MSRKVGTGHFYFVLTGKWRFLEWFSLFFNIQDVCNIILTLTRLIWVYNFWELIISKEKDCKTVKNLQDVNICMEEKNKSQNENPLLK
jgi:hypothetical protein